MRVAVMGGGGGAMKSKVAGELRKETDEAVRRMTAEERMALALALGERGLRTFAANGPKDAWDTNACSKAPTPPSSPRSSNTSHAFRRTRATSGRACAPAAREASEIRSPSTTIPIPVSGMTPLSP